MPGEANDIAVSGSLVYLAATTGGLRIVDLSSPTRPVELGSYIPPRHAYGVSIDPPYAYLAAAEAGLRIVDVSNPAAPFEVGASTPTRTSPIWMSPTVTLTWPPVGTG